MTLVDSGHSVRGSWGDTRAMHATMEDDVRIKVRTDCDKNPTYDVAHCKDYQNRQLSGGKIFNANNVP